MSKYWLPAAAIGTFIGVEAWRGRKSRRGLGRRGGVRYDSAANEAWVAFFSDDRPTAEGMRLGKKFRDRIEYLVDNKFNLPDDAGYPDLDDLAFLSYASHAGHGIGLWEKREPWHRSFEKVVMADKQARDLGYRLDEEVYEGQVAAGEAGRRAKRRKPSKRAREEWMRRYDKLMGSPQPPPHDYWDTATYLFNRGISPDEAAARRAGRRAKTNFKRGDRVVSIHPSAPSNYTGRVKGPSGISSSLVRVAWDGDDAPDRTVNVKYLRHAAKGRRAKSKRDFVKRAWERQAPTVTGGPLPPPIPGMEGPFRYRSGKILYWDPKEGKYYDRGRDMYVEVEDVEVAMSGRQAKSHSRRVSKCISGKVRGEGWDQRRAVAACLNMNREGRLRADGSYKRNGAALNPIVQRYRKV